jgi:hypothetical protein
VHATNADPALASSILIDDDQGVTHSPKVTH